MSYGRRQLVRSTRRVLSCMFRRFYAMSDKEHFYELSNMKQSRGYGLILPPGTDIEIQIVGTCEAQWTRSRPTMPYIKIYSEKISLLYIEMDIFGDTFGKTISPGIYNFPFHFVLSEDLPSSFESSFAKVNYFIKVRTKGRCKRKKIVPFIVLGNINLNNLEEYLHPSTYIFQKMCWNSKSLSIRFKTYSGFASKQNIPFQVAIENDKKAKITKINVELIQKLRYTISEGYFEEERRMCNVEYKKMQNTEYETCSFNMTLPSLTPSSIYLINPVIDISYVFRVIVVFLFHSSIYEEIPVIVATAPVIHDDFDDE